MRKILISGKNFLLCIFFTIVLMGISYYMLIGKSTDIRYSTITNNEKKLELISNQIETYMGENIKLNRILGQTYKYMLKENISKNTTKSIMYNILKNHNDSLFVSVLDLNGNVKFTTDDKINDIINLKQYFNYSDIKHEILDKKDYVTFVKGIDKKYQDMMFIASYQEDTNDIVLLSLKMDELDEIINNYNISKDKYACIWDSNYNIITHPQKPKASKLVNNCDYVSKIINQSNVDKINTKEYVCGIDQKLKLYSFKQIKYTTWTIINVKEVSNIFIPVFKNIFINITAGITLIFISYWIANTWVSKFKREQDFIAHNIQRIEVINNLSIGVSHKLKNPFSSISGFVQMHISKPPTDFDQSVLNDIDKVKTILDQYSKLPKSSQIHLMKSYCPSEVLDELFLVLEAIALLTDIDIQYNINIHNQDDKTNFPKDYLKLIILNLIEIMSDKFIKYSNLNISMNKNENFIDISISSQIEKNNFKIEKLYDYNIILKILKMYKLDLKISKNKSNHLITISIPIEKPKNNIPKISIEDIKK